jgi:uncharacterized protein YhdP
MKHLSDSVESTPQSLSPDLKTKSAWRRALHWALGLLALAGVAVCLAWSALHIFIVPRIGDYREALQEQATRALGLRVEIGSISAQGGWWVPGFELTQVQLFDREGREALLLPRVGVALSPRSLLLGVTIKLLALSRTRTYDFLSEPRMGGSEKNWMFEE